MRAVNSFARATPWLHTVLYAYATYGVLLFAGLLVTGWWMARRTADPSRVAAALWAGAGTLVAVGLNQPIVDTVAEPRPYTAMPGLLVLAQRGTDFSFPSDHATMAGAVAAGLVLVNRRLGALATGAAGAIAFARVYIAAHYPHDVLAGLLLGAAITLGGWWLLHTPLTRLIQTLGRTRLGPLVQTHRPANPPPSPTQGPTQGCLPGPPPWASPRPGVPATRPPRSR
jgi:undecaprenyl-diphosphatase